MTTYDIVPAIGSLEGVRRKRMLAFLVDFLVVSIFTGIAWVVLSVLGIFTFGLAWLLIPPAFTVIAILYSGSTIGGDRHATLGMRAAGLVFRLQGGYEPGFVHGAIHVVLFYLSVTFLTPLVLLVSLFNGRKRLLHDIVIDAIIVNDR